MRLPLPHGHRIRMQRRRRLDSPAPADSRDRAGDRAGGSDSRCRFHRLRRHAAVPGAPGDFAQHPSEDQGVHPEAAHTSRSAPTIGLAQTRRSWWRLRQGRDPPRADHDRQTVYERADEFKREAARADHDRGAELHHRHPARSQYLARLDPAPQMLAERSVACGEAAEVHDSLNPRPPRRIAEVAGAARVGIFNPYCVPCPPGTVAQMPADSSSAPSELPLARSCLIWRTQAGIANMSRLWSRRKPGLAPVPRRGRGCRSGRAAAFALCRR